MSWWEITGLIALSAVIGSFLESDPVDPTETIPWLLMTWLHKEPGHQQPWFWPNCFYTVTPLRIMGLFAMNRDHFVYVLSQWETTLQCNVISHWLGTFTIWSLHDPSGVKFTLATSGTLKGCFRLCQWFSLPRLVLWINHLPPHQIQSSNKANLRDLIAATGLVILLKLDSNHWFFSPCHLEIWWMTLKNNRAPLLRNFMLFASFRS